MRAFISATASVALTLAEVNHADAEEHLSLLQLSARPRSVAENSDDLDALDVDDLDLGGRPTKTWPAPADIRRGFGPDGTWATPYCKNIKGCLNEEKKCPPGCNGAAYWERAYPANSALGIPRQGKKTFHYLGCKQGVNKGGAIGSLSSGDIFQNCFNGPDSDKPPLTSSDPAWPAQNGVYMAGRDPSQTFHQNEFCPADCVNDCAIFKFGQFLGCGSTMGKSWAGYDGGFTKDVGPNPMCSVGVMGYFGGGNSYTWCGEPTTTTTTTPPPPPPPPVEEPVDEAPPPPPVEEPVDEAGAVGDPHLTSNSGRQFDLE